MNKITYFILEDILQDFDALKNRLDEFEELDFVGHAGEVGLAVKKIMAADPDLLFWDLKLIGGTAFDVLKGLDELDVPLPYCIGTADRGNIDMETYQRFQHLFIDYFNKPFINSQFDDCIRAIILKMRKLLNDGVNVVHPPQDGYFFVETPSSGSKVRIDVAKIIYIEVQVSLLTIHLVNQATVRVDLSLSRFLTLLDEPSIRQVNRNTAINIRHLERYEGMAIYVLNKTEPVVLREGYRKRFDAALRVLNW